MPRMPHHSSNYGGKRVGAGRKVGSKTRYTQTMVEMAQKYDVHPVELLLMVVNDTEQTLNLRLNAAVHVLPYVAPRQAAIQVQHVNELDEMTPLQKANRIEHLLQKVRRHNPDFLLPEPKKETA